ncbi:acyl-CoA thioesterase [Uliginosibacterium sp. H3]|uniref:Acyl-CoA thioesterase n=1 Tax=Uliginosibacterium silvisoli TaxID=3114758 RepID=A0ABU6K7A1_9RHOO|nr:acyl-CoA thioesterase [Uliginosibacterium sp. H3]
MANSVSGQGQDVDADGVCRLPNHEPVLRVIPMPKDLNASGDVFGGWIMAHVDLAASIPAVRRARGRVVTVAVNAFVFKEPVFKSDLVSFYAHIIREGTTSMTVDVEVYSERDPADPKVVKVTEATLTYVAIDGQGKKRPLPPV